MPVWHRFTEEMRKAGELELVGIVQEQHPDRARLFAQWHGLDWPILWDPFNLTGSQVVPVPLAVCEHGIVRRIRPAREDFESSFLFADFEAPPGAVASEPSSAQERVVEVGGHPEGSELRAHYLAISDLLWRPGDLDRAGFDAAVERIEASARAHPGSGELRFHAGVARRMRYDSAWSRPEDFQAALDHWARSLDLEPNHYIRRRRIQQYGPRMDKPYAFYDWVAQARAEIAARGEEPHEVKVELTPAELAQPAREPAARRAVKEPDPKGRIARDEEGLVGVESAVAFGTGTSGRGAVASVHLAFRLDEEQEAHWNNEAEPLRVWLEGDGWRLERSLFEGTLPPETLSTEVRRFAFDVRPPATPGQEVDVLRGYALFYACRGADGVCVYLRKDFEVPVRRAD